MKQAKKFLYLSLAVLFFLEGIAGSQLYHASAQTIAEHQAGAETIDEYQAYPRLTSFVRTKKIMTRQQVSAKVTSLNQEIKTLQSQKKTEEAREKKERAGATYLYAEVVCSNPYILYDTLSSGYFWVNDYQYLNNLWVAATGYVKLTGNYRTYNGITCAECNSVKVVNKSSSIQKKINNKKKELKKCKNALKDKVKLQNTQIKAGKKEKIIRTWKYSGAYNELIWKSSDENIASVDEKGKVKAISEGTVTITAKASVSGITSKCTVTVWEESKEETEPGWDTDDDQDADRDYDNPDDPEGIDEESGGDKSQAVAESEMYFSQQEYYEEDSGLAEIYLYVNLREGDSIERIFIESSNEDIAVFHDSYKDRENRYKITMLLTGAGTVTITATTDHGLKAECTLTHYIDME